jgi:hypothetical protein
MLFLAVSLIGWTALSAIGTFTLALITAIAVIVTIWLPRTDRKQALELAMDFYDANCIDCPYRSGNGELPSLATVASDRAAEKAAREAAAQQAADERARRHQLRRERRHLLLAGEGHVVRDLAESLDRIDRAERRTGEPSPDETRAARQVIDTARGAPELFRPVLIDSLLELATDTTDATAFEAPGLSSSSAPWNQAQPQS